MKLVHVSGTPKCDQTTLKSGHLCNQDTLACPSDYKGGIIPSLKSGHLTIQDTFSSSKSVHI